MGQTIACPRIDDKKKKWAHLPTDLEKVLLRLLQGPQFAGDILKWKRAIDKQVRVEVNLQLATSKRLKVDWSNINDAVYGWALVQLGEVVDNHPKPKLLLVK